MTDDKAGGQYYWDKEVNIFWTWDTPALIARKFQDIVAAKNLGGIMAWSLGEDTYKFAHLDAMQNGFKTATTKRDSKSKSKKKAGGKGKKKAAKKGE